MNLDKYKKLRSKRDLVEAKIDELEENGYEGKEETYANLLDDLKHLDEEINLLSKMNKQKDFE